MNLAVGRAHCEPVLPECTELALAGLELGLPELKEYAIVSIAIVSIAIVSRGVPELKEYAATYLLGLYL